MGNANRLVGYVASLICASLFYMVWFAIVVGQINPKGDPVSLRFQFGFAFFFWLFSGMGAALVLLALPWFLAVLCHDRMKSSGRIYFPLIGAACTLAIGCVTASLSPKPFFVEDQTFFQGFVIALQREGICFLLTGFIFGLTFWLVSERRRHSSTVVA